MAAGKDATLLLGVRDRQSLASYMEAMIARIIRGSVQGKRLAQPRFSRHALP
jgi:hypothetical protein